MGYESLRSWPAVWGYLLPYLTEPPHFLLVSISVDLEKTFPQTVY
nr:MAG TPA: hypothetical protein [Bacteriophage sp.]